jgi:hypothetical protein
MVLQLRVLQINERAQGPLSWGAGRTCYNISNMHYNAERYRETATWLKRAVEAMGYSMGPTNYKTAAYRGYYKEEVDRMEPDDTMTQEHREFLAASEERARLAAQ